MAHIKPYIKCTIPLLLLSLSHNTFGQQDRLEQSLLPTFSFIVGANFSNPGANQTISPLDFCYYQYHPQGKTVDDVLWGGG